MPSFLQGPSGDVMRLEGLLGYLRPFDTFPGIAWCNLLCPHQFQSNTYVVLHSPVPCLLRDGLRVDSLDTPLEVPPVWLTSVLSGAFHQSVNSSSLKSQYLLAKRGTCLLWCGQPCCVSWYTIARMGSLCVLSFSFSIHGFVKAM